MPGSRGSSAHGPLAGGLLALALAPGCAAERTVTKPGPMDWLDSPEVLAVAFHPRREADAGRGAQFEALDVPVADGVTVGARFYPAGKDRPTLLFFHGNGEIVADYAGLAGLYAGAGANFLPVDYRGYGRSSGRPTISAMLADARTVFVYARQWLAARGYGGPLAVMGRSLGSAPALEIAAAYPAETAGLILDSGFADTAALLVRLGARLPAGLDPATLLGQERKIAAYPGPVLIIHGTHDRIIPVTDAEVLFRASPGAGKRLLKIEGGGHNDLLSVGMDRYAQALGEFVGALRRQGADRQDGAAPARGR